MHSILIWMMRMLSIFWRSFCIFIILLNRCDLYVEMMWTSAMHFLYFSHCCFHWLLWYYAIAMLSLVKIIAARTNHLRLNCIFTSSWIKLFRSITFLMMRKQEMMQLILIKWACISLHVYLIFCVQLLIQLCNMILFCSMFKWTCSELMYISAFRVLMLILLNIFATWRKVWFCSVSSLHSLFNSSFSFSCWCQIDISNAISDLITAEYIYLAFVKIVSHVKTSSQLSASIHVMWFTSIWWRYAFHCNFMFSCTFKTCTSNFNLIICYEHVWTDQSSDLTLINLIRASHDAMPSLNLAHSFESFSALLLVVQHFLHSFLSSFF